MSNEPENTAIHEAQRRLIGNARMIGPPNFQQSNDMYSIQVTMQSCLDAGAGSDLLSQIVAMYRRHYAKKEEMQSFINDMEVRYITSLEGDAGDAK
ncbi:hypothetical protein [Paenibacillus sp. FSL L8-0708]|uniref:hypothetical protein n=1 Tax=Paenibacillus sp. FSL L8-0708 TaxID=2975311 RepID=UPI0030F6281F